MLNFWNTYAQSYVLEEVDAQLCRIGNEDQQIRKKLMEAVQQQSPDIVSVLAEMKAIDVSNQKYVSELLDKHRWPEKLSDDANRALFFVIDHAQNPFAEKYFPLVKEVAAKGVLQQSDAATLEDRILMRNMKKQKYGTQSISKKNEKGENVTYIWPIEDGEKVDELRMSVGLSPINQYMQMLENQSNQKVIWDKEIAVSDFNITSFQ
jgi:hypothetical protein